MRFSTLVFLVLGAAALAAIGWVFWRATAETRNWHELLAFADRDPKSLDDDARSRFRALAKKWTAPGRKNGFEPHWILRLKGQGSSERILLFDGESSISIPSEYLLIVHVLDEEHRLRSSTQISAGWRTIATRVQAVKKERIIPWTFEVEVGNIMMIKGPMGRQIYSLIADTPVLLRLEDDSGALVPNTFEYPNRTIGGPIPWLSAEEWERVLRSPDPAEVLRGLVWLGGRHASTEPDEHRVSRENAQQVRIFDELRKREGVRKRLAELKQSPHPWIAEAAAAARSAP